MRARKGMLTAILGLVLTIGSFSITAEATKVVEIPETEIDSVYNLRVDSNAIEGWAKGPHIYSEAGIVMDVDSGAILYAKNIDDRHYPASITKVLTALVALQNYEMDEIIKFTWDDVGTLERGASHIGIKEDEELVMKDAMYGMMLASANEVANGIGSHMEGGYEAFLQEMNVLSQALGCTNSNWVNTNGLHDSEHYSSARDMALIAAEVFQNDIFREIIGTHQYTIPATNITAETRTFQQKHKMVWQSNANYYEYCVGGKTGYTEKALTTLVTYATKEDTNLVAVVMRTHGGGKNAYADTRAMIDYAFNNFVKVDATKVVPVNENISRISKDAYVMLPADITVDQLENVYTAPTEMGDRTGTVSFTYKGQPVGQVEVTVTDEYYNEIHGIKEIRVEEKKGKEDKKEGTSIVLKIVLVILGIIAVGFITLVGFVVYKRKQIEKRRRIRRMERRKKWEEEMGRR